MPERRELEVLTPDLQTGDTIKKSEYRNNILFGKKVAGLQDRFNTWVTVSFLDFDLPKSRRFKNNEWWTVWRELPTDVEKYEKILENEEKRLFRLANKSKEDLESARKRIAEPVELKWSAASYAQEFLKAAAERQVWLEITASWEARNQQRARGVDLEKWDPFWSENRDWGIGEAVYYWCTKTRNEILLGKMEFKQNWSNPMEQYWRNLQTETEYKQATDAFSSLWRYATDWAEAYRNLKEAKEKEAANATEPDPSNGDPEAGS